jgi:hypothetical protein
VLPFSIFLGGTQIGSGESQTGMAFQYESTTFTAAAGTYELLFQGYEPNPDTNIFEDNTAFFDQIQIAAVPAAEPSTFLLAIIGAFGFIACRWRRRASVPA